MAEIRKETVCFTNMCMVKDSLGRVVALNKRKGGYTGLTFPGGHLEEGESFYEAVIREVKEECGLDIESPLLCGFYHWMGGGMHNVILLYRADRFSGELKSSDEGEVFWIPLEKYRQMELAEGMEYVISICMEEGARECRMVLEDGIYKAELY